MNCVATSLFNIDSQYQVNYSNYLWQHLRYMKLIDNISGLSSLVLG